MVLNHKQKHRYLAHFEWINESMNTSCFMQHLLSFSPRWGLIFNPETRESFWISLFPSAFILNKTIKFYWVSYYLWNLYFSIFIASAYSNPWFFFLNRSITVAHFLVLLFLIFAHTRPGPAIKWLCLYMCV